MDPQPPRAQAAFELDGNPGSITAARHHTETFLAQLRPSLLPAVVQDAVLVVSELVTNAVSHAPGPCALDLLRQDHHLVIAVTDTSIEVPLQRPADLRAGTGGLGMHLVDRLAEITTVATHRDGKTVSATLRTTVAEAAGGS